MSVRRIRKAGWLGLLLLPTLSAQQDQTLPSDSQAAGWGTRTIELKYMDPEQLRSVFSGLSYVMEANRELKLLTVNGPPQFLKEVEETGKRLDVAPRLPVNIQLSIYLLAATPSISAQALPTELASLGKELAMPPPSPPFRVVDSQIMRMREGQPGELTLTEPSGTVPSLTRVKIRAAVANSDVALANSANKDSRISLDGFECSLSRPAASNSSQPRTDGDISASIDLLGDRPAILARSGVERPIVVVVRAAVVR